MPYDPTVSSVTAADHALAVVLLLVVLALAALVGTKVRYLGLDAVRAKTKARVERQLVRRTPGSVRISRSERGDLETYRDAVREAFIGAGAVDEPATVRGAAREARDAVLERVRPLLETVPPSVRRFGAAAVWILVFGALALRASDVAAALEGGRGLPPVEVMLELATSEPPAAVDLAHSWVATSPVLGTTLTLLYAYTVLFYEWLYGAWLVVVATLATVAVAIAVLDRRGARALEEVVVDDVATSPSLRDRLRGVLETGRGAAVEHVPDRVLDPLRDRVVGRVRNRLSGLDVRRDRTATDMSLSSGRRRVLLALGFSTAVVGLELAAIGLGRTVGSASTGRVYGAVVALGAFAALLLGLVWLVVRRLRRFRATWRSVRRAWDRPRYLLRTLGTATLVVATPLVPVWTVVGVSRLPVVVETWLAAPLDIQLATATVGVGLVVGAVLLVREQLRKAVSAVGEVLRRRSFRWRAIGVGVPLSVVAVAWVLWGSIAPTRPVLGLLVALAVGLIVRGGWFAYLRARSAVAGFDRSRHDAPQVVVHAYELDLPADAPASRAYFARVNSSPVAATDLGDAVDAVLERADDAFRDEEPAPTVHSTHARYLREDGVADVEVTRKRLREECRRRLEAWRGELPAADVERALRNGLTEGSRLAVSGGVDHGDGPVHAGEAGLRPVGDPDGLPDEVVDHVLDEELADGFGGRRAADGSVVGLDRPDRRRGRSESLATE